MRFGLTKLDFLQAEPNQFTKGLFECYLALGGLGAGRLPDFFIKVNGDLHNICKPLQPLVEASRRLPRPQAWWKRR